MTKNNILQVDWEASGFTPPPSPAAQPAAPPLGQTTEPRERFHRRLFLPRIAFFAGLAVFPGGYAAGVRASFAIGFGFFTAGLGTLEILSVGIAFFARLAGLVSGHTARVRTVLAIGLGLFTTGLVGGERRDGQRYADTEQSDQYFEEFHVIYLVDGYFHLPSTFPTNAWVEV